MKDKIIEAYHNFLQDKRGSMWDPLIYPILILVMLVTCVTLYTVLDSFSTDFIDAKWIIIAKDTLEIWDKGMIFIIVMMAVASIILASQIESHPVFVIPAIILMAVSVFLAAILANITWGLANSPQFITAATQFDTMLTINENLPRIVLVVSFLIAIALFGKPMFGSRETAYYP